MAKSVLHRLDVGAAADEQRRLGVPQLVEVVSPVSATAVALDPVAVVPGLDLLEGPQTVINKSGTAPLVEGGWGDEAAVGVVAARGCAVGASPPR